VQGIRRPDAHPTRARVALAAVAVAAAAVVPTGAATGAPTTEATAIYLVQLTDPPVASYAGGTAGLPATRPARGDRVDTAGAEVARYRAYLAARQDAALAQVGGRLVYRYTYAFDGFAAELGAGAAAALARRDSVVSVTPDTRYQVDTWVTPGFLGLDEPAAGLWDQVGGVGTAGEDVVVGLLDTGIWPENPGFAATDAAGAPTYTGPPPGWSGTCVAGEDFPAETCNGKLIGARYYDAGFGGPARVKTLFPYEYLSARDADGHGSHTSSTAGGNHGVAATVTGFPTRSISGMAPRARLAMYKVCWGRTEITAGCFASDSVAAIDQAVADGVDVLNFSIGGSTTDPLTPVEVAFLNAAAAGVFVATSAGNSGPDPRTVQHGGPWVTTVGAAYHDHTWPATVTLAGGPQPLTATGLSQTASLPPTPVVLAASAAAPGANAAQASLCFADTLDAAKVQGNVVVCDRGTIGRTEKSRNVADAGGAGMILANLTPIGLNVDLHFVPSIHVEVADGNAIKAYVAANPTATAAIATPADFVLGPGRQVVPFSSRGPFRGGGDVLKPDLVGPGVDILAATSPAILGRDWDLMSGTSMSSPHLAGLAALLRQRHPDWSPMAIKSALMTTASTSTKNTAEPLTGTAFDYGAGFVVPNAAADPGLVYDSGELDWTRYACGLRAGAIGSRCAQTGAIDASDVNQASIAVDGLAGSQTVSRVATNVSAAATYTVTVATPPGIDVVVTPPSLSLGAGQSVPFTVTLTNVSAPLGQYAFGSLTWSDGMHSVRSPLVVRPIAPLAG
jgi:subtilisin family serine protease